MNPAAQPQNSCPAPYRMQSDRLPEPVNDEPILYQFRLKGHLAYDWADWFDGLTLSLESNGDTLLTGPVTDQAALHGLLRRVRDLGVPLVSLNPVCCSDPQLAHDSLDSDLHFKEEQ